MALRSLRSCFAVTSQSLRVKNDSKRASRSLRVTSFASLRGLRRSHFAVINVESTPTRKRLGPPPTPPWTNLTKSGGKSEENSWTSASAGGFSVIVIRMLLLKPHIWSFTQGNMKETRRATEIVSKENLCGSLKSVPNRVWF